MKKISLWLVVLSMIMTMLPGTIVSAEDAWVHVEAEAGMGMTQHSAEGYGASGNCALIGHNHDGGGANLNGSNSVTVAIPAAGEYDVFAIVGRGDVNDPSNSRGSYTFSIGDDVFFESAVGRDAITPISESFKQLSLGRDTYAQKLYWVNAGTVTLPAGDVVLNLEITGQGIIDCVRFVPAAWEWVPTGANLDAPEDMSSGNGGNEDDEEDVNTNEWVDVEAEAGMGITQHSAEGYGASGNCALIGHNHDGGGANLNGSNSVTVAIPAAGDYDVYAVVGRGDVNDPSNSRGSYKFSIGEDVFFTSAVGRDAITPASSESFKQLSLGADTYAQKLYWVNAGTVTLPAGDVVLNLEITGQGIIDCVRFVPAAWEWVPTGANLDAPEDMSSGNGGNEDDEEDSDVIATEWFDIEAEAGTYTGTLLTRTENERTYFYTIQGSPNAAKDTTSTFTLGEEGTYDIWAVVGLKNADYLAVYEFELGGEQIYYKNMNAVYAEATGDAMFTTEQNVAAGNQLDMRWVKIAAAKTITAGTATTITSKISACPVGNALGMIDVVRFVPSDWEWVPDSNFDDPTDMSSGNGGNEDDEEDVNTNEWVDVEAEVGMGITQHSPEGYGASGNCALVGHNHDGGGANLNGSNSVTVAIPAAGDYDVYAVVGRGDVNDPSNSRGSYKFSIGEDVFFTSAVGRDAIAPASSESFKQLSLGADTYAQKLYWVNAGTVTLPAGDVELNLEITGQGIIDCVRFVPAAWEWVPTGANFDDPTDMSSENGGNDDNEDDEEDDDVTGDNDPTVDGYVHAEAENATFNEASYTERSHEQASSGKVLIPLDTAAPEDTQVIFNVVIPEDQEYDVFALVAYRDYTPSPWEMLVDGNSFAQPLMVGSGTLYGMQLNAGYDRKMSWVKMGGNVELTAGELDVIAHLPAQTNTQYNSYFTAIDAIRIVPSDWYWSPSASLDAPEQILNLPNEDGALLLEAENGSLSGSMTRTEFAKASGGAYVASKTVNANPGSVTMGFVTEEEEKYDIWAAVATNPVNWLGGYVVNVDGNEIYNSCLVSVDTSNPDLYGETVVLHTGNSSGSASTVRWVKVGTKKTIASGGHTITVSTRSGTGAGNTTGLVDCVALIPSSWKWAGSDELALPEKPDNIIEDGVVTTAWFDIQVENGTPAEKNMSVGTASGNSYMQFTQGMNSATVARDSVNEFKTTESRTYDIWAVVGTHTGGANLSSYTFTLDGDTFDPISAGKYDEGANLYTGPTAASGYPMSMAWVRVAKGIELPAGDHKLIAEITRSGAHANNFFGAIDMVSFIPSEWGLSETTSLSVQLANAIKNKYFTGDYSALTGDITIPEVVIPTIAGTTITYESDNTSVIASDGTITRPYFNAENANVNFNVVANYGDVQKKVAIPMTVLKNDKYTVSDVAISEELAASASFSAMLDVKVNASAESGITGKAALVVALYNADGSLADIAIDTDAVSTERTTFTASITLPADVTGMTAKVYLTNGFTMGNQLMETVVVD